MLRTPESASQHNQSSSVPLIADESPPEAQAGKDGDSHGPYHVGYHEAEIAVTYDRADVSIWFPMNAVDHCRPIHDHKLRMRHHKLLETEIGHWTDYIKSCVPMITCCMGLVPAESTVPATSFSADPSQAAPVRGIIIYNHGNLTSRFDLVHVVEYLASHGWAVAAPSFADSAFNDRLSYLRTGQAEGEYIVLGQHTIDCVQRYMKRLFGDLPVGMIGYSMGTYMMRYSSWDCPFVFVSGPGISEDDKCELPAFQGNPFLQFRGEPGELGVIDYMNNMQENSNESVGPPWDKNEAPGWVRINASLSSKAAAAPIDSVQQSKYTTVVIDDISHVMWLHPSIFRLFGQFKEANGPGNQPKAAMKIKNMQLMGLLPATINAFFEAHIDSKGAGPPPPSIQAL